MGFLNWLGQDWFTLLQSAGIIGSLFFAAISWRVDAKARQIGNLVAITQQHKDIWTQLYKRPELSRALDPAVDLEKKPLAGEEELFVTLLILHLSSAYRAMKSEMFSPPEGLERDIRRFFSLPIPKLVWERMKTLQDRDFVRFVESCLGRS